MGTNTDVMLTVGAGFTDKTDPASYFNGANTGVCQICHDASDAVGGIDHYNLTDVPDGHNASTVCTQCHAHTSTPVAFVASCTDCHGNASNGNYWPDSDSYGVENGTVYPNRLGSHERHINKIATQNFGATPTMDEKNSTCNWCHPSGSHTGDQTGPHADLMDGTTTVFKDIVGDPNARTSVVLQPSDGIVSCATVDCHYSDNEPMPNTAWFSPASDSGCGSCHYISTSAGTGKFPNAHDTHVDDSGVNMNCSDCHVGAGSNDAHQNGVVDFTTFVMTINANSVGNAVSAATASSDLGPKYGLGTVATQYASCANLYCHGEFVGGDNTNDPNWFNTDAQIAGANNGDGACGTCHGTDASATPNSNKHTVHLDSTTYIDGSCAECHTNTTTHVDGTVDLGGVATVAGASTCTNLCHTLDGLDDNAGVTADNPAWVTANSNALGCEDCHVSGLSWTGAGSAALTRGLPPTSGEHTQHMDNTYMQADCTDCHADNSASHSTLDDSVAVGADKVSAYNDVAKTCTNSCHTLNGVDNTGSTADDSNWTINNALGCSDCHISGKAGLINAALPTSGLHDVGNTMTVKSHTTVADIGAVVCLDCHNADPSTTHIEGGAPEAEAAATYNSWDANIVRYNSAVGCAATCHTDGGDWDRKWNSVTNAIPLNTDSPGDAVCDNCHGDFSGWRWDENNATTTNHTNPYDQGGLDTDTMSEHSVCQTCHGWDNANYEETWLGSSNINYKGHGDGYITLNGPAPTTGAQYDDSTGGCAAACHAPAYFLNTNSGWDENYMDGGSGACDSCHAAAANNVIHGNTSENDGLHNTHIDNVLVDVTGEYDFADIATWDDCTTCHPHNGEFVALNLHDDGNVDFAGELAGTPLYAKGASFGGTCAATNGCHDSDATEWQSGDLSSTGDNGCADCHASAAGWFSVPNGWPQAQGKHAEHVAKTAYVAGSTCVDCHNDNTTTHSAINNVATAVGGSKLTTFTTPNCANKCHNVDATTDGWLTGALECLDCHVDDGSEDFIGDNAGANLPASGLHAATTALAHDDNFDSGATCISCHNSDPTTTHIDGTLEDEATTTYNAWGSDIVSYSNVNG